MRLTVMFALLLTLAAPALVRAADERAFQECADCPLMIGVPAGDFRMGSPADEPGRFDAEGPLHRVTVKSFALGKFPVTVAEFLLFLRASGYQPAPCSELLGLQWHGAGHGQATPPTETLPPDWPATCLNWQDAQAYIDWLNAKLQKQGSMARYRLPSEAEWEYAARAGGQTARWWGEAVGSGHANCNGCGSAWDGHAIAPVGSFGENPFGLSDMLGNVWQWVADCWNESYLGAPDDGSAWQTGTCRRRVIRGGSWSSLPVFVRSAARAAAAADGSDFDYSYYVGFRLARSLP